jgi:hypothetical protein
MLPTLQLVGPIPVNPPTSRQVYVKGAIWEEGIGLIPPRPSHLH